MYRIGVTEAGDAGLDLSWEGRLGDVDGAIVITKRVSPEFMDAVMRNTGKLIVHATVTGHGGTVLEPGVPRTEQNLVSLSSLVRDRGFPIEKVVVRIDPIIPTKKGIKKADSVMSAFIESGFRRFRISMLDMYKHVEERFRAARLPIPCDWGKTTLKSRQQFNDIDWMIEDLLNRYRNFSIRVESCAEPLLTSTVRCGCVSEFDLRLLCLEANNDSHAYPGRQRKDCMCYAGKVELLTQRKQCPHGCLYCYWKDN